jgi:hypothetical protein
MEDFSTMAKLRDGHVKLGMARHEFFACSNRLVVNQMRPGTVNCYTLLNILKRISEHLWVFQVQ